MDKSEELRLKIVALIEKDKTADRNEHLLIGKELQELKQEFMNLILAEEETKPREVKHFKNISISRLNFTFEWLNITKFSAYANLLSPLDPGLGFYLWKFGFSIYWENGDEFTIN